MVKVKSLEEISNRYKEAASLVPGRYKRAVEKVTDWKERALAGQTLYEEKLADPTIRARRAKAIEKVSNEDWRKNAADIGAKRIGEGMRAKVDKHKAKYKPFRDALAALTLPEKVADPMANIDNRLKAVVSTLIETKKAELGE